MKIAVACLALASTLLLVGCCTTQHAAQRWEYKITASDPTGPEGLDLERLRQALDASGEEGWILVAKDGSLFFWKRPMK